MPNRPLLPALSLLLLAGFATAAPQPALAAGSPVTLEKIMSDPEWLGIPPENPYWADDGRAVYFERKRAGEDEINDLYRLDLAEGSAPVRVADADRGRVDVAGGDVSEDRAWKVYARQGDLYLKDLKTGALRQLTRTADVEADPRFLVGDTRISFRRGTSAVYACELPTGLISQLAELRLEKDPAAAETKEKSYVEERQLELLLIVQKRKHDREAKREAERAEQRADPTRAPLPWYLGEGIEIAQVSLSPSGDWLIVVTRPKEVDEGKGSPMADFVTESGYVETKQVRSKVGTGKPVSPTVLLLDLKTHEKHEVDLSALPGIKDDPLRQLREAAAAARRAKAAERDGKDGKDNKDGKEGKDGAKPDETPALRVLELEKIIWSDDGRRAAFLFFSYDNKDRWIATLEPPAAGLVTRHRLTDPAWVNDYSFFDFGWLPDSTTLWYLSEETGTSHLYTLQTADAGAKARQLTRGSFEVASPVPARDGKSFYYKANASHPGIYDAWRVDVASARSEQVSTMGGQTDFLLSPDESQLLLTNSQIVRPDELFVQAATAGAAPRRLTQTVSPEFLSFDWTVPEIVAVPSTHASQPVYARLYTPKGFDPAKKYPAVFFVHGAGYLQNAHAGWSTYFREFMFHTFLAQHGYVVLDMDYRASAGYGRDWRTAIYRRMGTPELEDLEDGVAWVTRNKGVDPARIGVYGGSYGGFMVLIALFRQPDLFAAGAALRPVTGWAHYNQGYTANILNTPDVDPEAYRTTSPIEDAAGLRKPLLLCHGMQDDNVHFQDTVLLVQHLIELKKENFETAIYPVEPHGFLQPTSWLDEYRRIFKLMETYVKPAR